MKTIAAPDGNPVIPAYVAPAGACDAHCHIFGPADRFPYFPTRRYTPPDAPRETLAALHRRLGLSRAVLVQASCHGTDNRAMLDAIAWSNGAWRGVAMVDQEVTDRELDALHAGGVRGVRFNFVAHLGGAPDLDVTNAVTGQPLCDATVTASEGQYSERLFEASCRFPGAYERPGTYVIRAEKAGFRAKEVGSVRVVMGPGPCPHVQEVRVAMPLTPEG